jgi:hypothetical protein
VADGERHRWRRFALIAAGGVVAEAALFGLARSTPAMAGLIRPLYAAVGAVLAYFLWHAAQQRRGKDRRQVHRRGDQPPSDVAP